MTRPVPICRHCTNVARTVDTPRVKVRVASAVVYRDADGLRVLSRCHGAVCVTFLRDTTSETDLEATEVFRGEG